MSERASDSEERLNRYPILKKRFFSLPVGVTQLKPKHKSDWQDKLLPHL